MGAKVVLMNFWATWCEACTEEMPSIVELRDAYKSGKDFGSRRDQSGRKSRQSPVPRAEKELGIRFPVFTDGDSKITDYFDVHAIPLSLILGADRKILFIENGGRNWNDREIHQKMDQWLSDEKN